MLKSYISSSDHKFTSGEKELTLKKNLFKKSLILRYYKKILSNETQRIKRFYTF